MKNKLFKISLLSLFISQSIAVANAETISKSSGATTPVSSEFTPSTLGYGNPSNPQPWRAKYNEPRVNKMFIETFHLKIPKRCKVAKATLQVRVKNLGAQNYNDSIYMTSAGGTNLYGQKIWTNQGVGATQTLVFNLANLPTGSLVLAGAGTNILNSLSDGRFSFLVQDDTQVQSATMEYDLSGRGCGGSGGEVGIKGMTWSKKGRDATTGVITVGCKHGGYNCNPSNGDQLCTIKHPILCTRDLNADKPQSVAQPNKYNKWSGAIVHTSRLVAPATEGIGTLTQANKICFTEFGKGWKVAEFHDGWGWNFTAYGNTGKKKKRFWVNINNKPNGNCWNQQ